MHIGRQYKMIDFLAWTRRETLWLVGWSSLATLLLHATGWAFLTVPVPILTIVGSALAISLAFKSQQCYTRFNDGLMFAGQLMSASLTLTNKLLFAADAAGHSRSSADLRPIFDRHFAWLTSLRFHVRERRVWENTFDAGNMRYLGRLPHPERGLVVSDELKPYLSDAEIQTLSAYTGDKEALILHWQYAAVADLFKSGRISELLYTVITSILDDLLKLQGGLKRVKNYPYSRNYYSIAVILVKVFIILLPFSLFQHAEVLAASSGIPSLTVWLNVPFSVVVGWIFISLEKVGENSSNPFEGNANDVPISSITRRIQIDMLHLIGQPTELKPVEPQNNILF